MKYSDVISWNTLIRALACNGLQDEAWKIFGVMRESDTKPNSHTIISILATCEDETCINIVRAIHGFVIKHGIEADLSLNTALTDMYMNCGDEAAARTVFEGCPSTDVISWNALIASYIKNNEIGKAQLLFNRMVSEVNPNSVTIINILSSCTQLASPPLGQCLHAYANRRQFSFGFDLSLANAFISMYARSGSMQNAEKMFKTLPKRNVISWNALITGYSMHALEDIPSLVSEDEAALAYQNFAYAWDSLSRERSSSSIRNLVLQTIAKVYMKENIWIAFCAFLRNISVGVSPLLLYAFVNDSNSDEENLYEGLIIVGCLILSKVVESLSQRHWFFDSRRCGMRMRSALMVAVYQKQLKLSSLGRSRYSAGEIVNYIAVDAYRIGEFPWWLHTNGAMHCKYSLPLVFFFGWWVLVLFLV
ncbi:hypothetical protein ACE6H2_009895 [Prunus campanulata]